MGTLLAGIFASANIGVFSGQGYNEGMSMISQVGVQMIGVFATVSYTALATFIIFKIVNSFVSLRIDDEGELKGLDLVEHDERGYDL